MPSLTTQALIFMQKSGRLVQRISRVIETVKAAMAEHGADSPEALAARQMATQTLDAQQAAELDAELQQLLVAVREKRTPEEVLVLNWLLVTSLTLQHIGSNLETFLPATDTPDASSN